jgi:hypothetical protein
MVEKKTFLRRVWNTIKAFFIFIITAISVVIMGFVGNILLIINFLVSIIATLGLLGLTPVFFGIIIIIAIVLLIIILRRKKKK